MCKVCLEADVKSNRSRVVDADGRVKCRVCFQNLVGVKIEEPNASPSPDEVLARARDKEIKTPEGARSFALNKILSHIEMIFSPGGLWDQAKP